MSKNDGGPAFPVGEWNNDARKYVIGGGMTLRQWYAGQALAGLCAEEVHRASIAGARTKFDQVAEKAFEYADAMLREEQK